MKYKPGIALPDSDRLILTQIECYNHYVSFSHSELDGEHETCFLEDKFVQELIDNIAPITMARYTKETDEFHILFLELGDGCEMDGFTESATIMRSTLKIDRFVVSKWCEVPEILKNGGVVQLAERRTLNP